MRLVLRQEFARIHCILQLNVTSAAMLRLNVLEDPLPQLVLLERHGSANPTLRTAHCTRLQPKSTKLTALVVAQLVEILLAVVHNKHIMSA